MSRWKIFYIYVQKGSQAVEQTETWLVMKASVVWKLEGLAYETEMHQPYNICQTSSFFPPFQGQSAAYTLASTLQYKRISYNFIFCVWKMLGKSLENRLDENRKMEWRKPNITSVSGWEKANFTFMMGEMDNKQSLKNLWKFQEGRELRKIT